MVMLFLLINMVAYGAFDTPAEDVIEELSDSFSVNWTRGVVVGTAVAPDGRVSYNDQEKLGRGALGRKIIQAWGWVSVDGQESLGDLRSAYGKTRLPSGGKNTKFTVTEVTYQEGAPVKLQGEISLVSSLRPWIMSEASAKRKSSVVNVGYNGVVLDARGCGFSPVLRPKIVSDKGELLYDGLPLAERALKGPSVIYVYTPMHPAASQMVSDPWVVIASDCRRGEIILTGETAAEFAKVGAEVATRFGVVVVVDR